MNNQQKLDDIIFAHRNKAYGAYVHRSDYSSTLLKSVLSMILFTGIIVSICFALMKKGNQSKTLVFILPPEQIVSTTTVNLAEQRVVQKKENNIQSQKDNKGDNASLVIRDSVTFTTDTSQINKQPSDLHNKGDEFSGAGNNSGGKDEGKTDGKGSGTKSDTAVAIVADEFPEFEGGPDALKRWVASKLRYPEDAIDHSKQGKVHVKFIVDEEGKVLYPKALNRLGFGLEEEALRVVSLIPNFKSPAKIDGKPVKCYFVLPINFKLY